MYHIIVLAFITLKSIELVAKNKQTFESGSKNFNLSYCKRTQIVANNQIDLKIVYKKVQN
jgi:hypothetical protein